MRPATDSRRLPAGRFALLLASLILLIFVRPFLAEPSGQAVILEALLITTLLAGVWATARRRRDLVLIGILAGLVAASRFLRLESPESRLWTYAFLGTYAAFFLAVVTLLLRSLATARHVTTDTICGAIAVYLLFGLLWTLIYAAIEVAAPGSFTVPGMSAEDGARFERFLGFSFTTLTTLGYGNIAPTTPKADAAANLEAITGQMYLAVFMARLVALQLVQSTAEEKNAE